MRNHKEYRFALSAATAAIAFGLLVGQSAWAITYQAVPMCSIGSDFSVINTQAFGTSGTQQVGGGNPAGIYPDFPPVHALLWSGMAETVIDLNPTAKGIFQSAAAATNGTQQVGWGSGTVATGGKQHALFWSGTAASAVDLNPTAKGFSDSVALGISSTQQVGYGTNSATASSHALLWSGTADSAIDLNPSGFLHSKAQGISGAQQVGTGSGVATGYNSHALLWSGTAASYIDLNPTGFGSSEAYATNGTQQVGDGGGTATGGQTHALLWSGTAASRIDLHPSDFTRTYAYGLSSTQQVGWGTPTGSNDHAIIWSGTADSAVDLHQFLPSNLIRSYAYAVDEQGNIVGFAMDAWNRSQAILWVPVPEPSTFALLGVGAFGLLAWRWRKAKA